MAIRAGFAAAAIAAAALFTGCANVAVRSSERDLPFAGAYSVHRFVLPNGLRLLVIPDESSPTLSYQTWYRVGSADEAAGKTGLAHLFEHMMFRRTENYGPGEMNRVMTEAGVDRRNAFTERDFTVYVQELPREALETVARAEAERMVKLVIDEEAYRTEVDVVLSELGFRRRDNPHGELWDKLYEAAFHGHPYGHSVVGTERDLKSTTAADALSFYRKHYRPSNATIVIAGNAGPEDALAVVSRFYGGIADTEADAPPAPAGSGPAVSTPGRVTRKVAIAVEKLLLAFPLPRVGQAELALFEPVQALLCGGKASRLRRALVHSGIASSVSCSAEHKIRTGVFEVEVELQKGRRAAEAETAVFREIRRLATAPQAPAREDELKRARQVILSSFYSGMSSNSGRSYFAGHYEGATGDFAELTRIRDRALSAELPEIQRAMAKYLAPEKAAVVVGVPK